MSASATPAESAAPPRLGSIQFCRGAAAWLVVFYHLGTLNDGFWSPTARWAEKLRALESIGFAGVDLFFVISGVVMMVTCWRRLGERGEVAPFLKRRVARIYPLNWLATAAVLAIWWWAPQLANPAKTEPWFVAKSLALWPQQEMPVVTVAWTLTYEMCFYLAFAALIALPRRWAPPALAGWAAAIVATPLVADPATCKLFDVPAVFPPLSPLALEFIAGCAIGWLYFRGRMPAGRSMLALGLTTFFGLGAWSSMTDAAAGTDWTRVAIFGAGSTLIIYGLAARELAGGRRVPASLTFWGDASYSLYLTHGYVIQAFGLLAARWPAAQQGAPKLALTVACLAACGAVAAICHVAVERPVNAAARRALEGRRGTRPAPAAAPAAAHPAADAPPLQ
jgi:peptidoglycan/LPS O-acetylase OafA/YrhL